jgi:hypothetical protein
MMAARFEHSGGRIFNAARRSSARCSASHTDPFPLSPTGLPEQPYSFHVKLVELVVHTQYETCTGFLTHHFQFQMVRGR